MLKQLRFYANIGSWPNAQGPDLVLNLSRMVLESTFVLISELSSPGAGSQ